MSFTLLANVSRRCGRLVALYSRRIFENSNTLIKKNTCNHSEKCGRYNADVTMCGRPDPRRIFEAPFTL